MSDDPTPTTPDEIAATVNPYAVIARKAQAELRRWGDVLGLNPAARKRLGATRSNPDPKENLDGRLDFMLLERRLAGRRVRAARN